MDVPQNLFAVFNICFSLVSPYIVFSAVFIQYMITDSTLLNLLLYAQIC